MNINDCNTRQLLVTRCGNRVRQLFPRSHVIKKFVKNFCLHHRVTFWLCLCHSHTTRLCPHHRDTTWLCLRHNGTTKLCLHYTVLRSAKRAPATVRRLNNRKWRQRYCLVGERSRALALLNAAQAILPTNTNWLFNTKGTTFLYLHDQNQLYPWLFLHEKTLLDSFSLHHRNTVCLCLYIQETLCLIKFTKRTRYH